MTQQDTRFESIEISLLATVGGGQAQQGGDARPGAPRRTWGQVAQQYGAACVVGAGQSLSRGPRPRNWRQAAGTAAMGCVLGVGARAAADVSQAVGTGE